MIINFSIERYSITLINEDKSYDIKSRRFEKVAVEPIHFTVVTIQSRHQSIQRRANTRNVTYCKRKDKKKQLLGFAIRSLLLYSY